MSKRRIIIALLICVALTAATTTMLFRSSEPYHNGRSLSDWVRLSREAALRGGDTNVDAAIHSFGTNAIPFLLEWIRYEPQKWNVNRMFKTVGISWRFRDGEQSRAASVEHAFQILGTEAVGAIPQLAQIMNDHQATNAAQRATAVLTKMRSKCLPALLALMTNDNRTVRIRAIANLPVYYDGTNADTAVPVLLGLLEGQDTESAEVASTTLGILRRQPERVVPVMINRLQNSRPSARYSAAFALCRLGPDSRAAIPGLKDLLTDPEFRVRKEATNALLKIAPEVLTNAPPR